MTEEQKQKLEEIKSMHEEGEQFTGFINTTTNEVLSEDAQINSNVTIEPKYEAISVTPTPDLEENTNNNNNVVSDSEETNSKSVQTASSNPSTSDNIITFVIIGIIGLICITFAIKLYKKNK